MQERHDRPTEHAEVDLGPLVLQIADEVEEHAEKAAERDATAALDLPHTYGAVAIASATDLLLTRIEGLAAGVELIPVCRRGARALGVLARWETLKAKGPEPDPLGNWSYMREMAHLTRDMARVLREHRAAEQPKTFVDRTNMPPLAPDAR